ncbi:RNA-guided endonuclease TnpB family protein [Streptomyces canus]|uniref:RNA-guided endonuclease InsQ/TnpB family protein n=1 Tax=Streptomyces canus TaxID=58343 RepID=UPI00035C5E6E|nr:RNA-guided endonuclease TnpB family protein [Streptomyces canus]
MATTHVKRAFKYRFCPSDAQAAELSRTFGRVQKVYNMALEARNAAWNQRRERVNCNATSAMLTAWKKTEELACLTEVSPVPLQQCLRHLQGALTNFFDGGAKYPRFTSRKKSRRCAGYTSSAFGCRDGAPTLAKMREPLDIVWSRPLPEGAARSTVTVSQDAAGRWFVSMPGDDAIAPAQATTAAVGIDTGITSLVTVSTGEKATNPRHERRDRGRLAKAQRELSRKEKDSDNRAKARVKVTRVHARITDRRRDFPHQLTTRLVREDQTVVIEDLSLRTMVTNHTLARAKLPLNIRWWTCDCGTVHDRDVNAAHNILAAGLAVSACGDGVRPQRITPGGQSSMRQEPPTGDRGTPRL